MLKQLEKNKRKPSEILAYEELLGMLTQAPSQKHTVQLFLLSYQFYC